MLVYNRAYNCNLKEAIIELKTWLKTFFLKIEKISLYSFTKQVQACDGF